MKIDLKNIKAPPMVLVDQTEEFQDPITYNPTPPFHTNNKEFTKNIPESMKREVWVSPTTAHEVMMKKMSIFYYWCFD